MRLFKLVIILLVFTGCENVKQKTKDSVVVQGDIGLPSKAAISKIKYIDILPDKKTKVVLESWQAYNTVSKAIHDIKKGNFDFFTGDFNAFELAVKDIETTIPKTVETLAIKARLLALKTKLFKFQDVVNLSTSTKQENLVAIKDVFQAFSNLTLQMNKKFEKESQKIEKLKKNEK